MVDLLEYTFEIMKTSNMAFFKSFFVINKVYNFISTLSDLSLIALFLSVYFSIYGMNNLHENSKKKIAEFLSEKIEIYCT